jgi:Outer membrane protein beta-barrel domain
MIYRLLLITIFTLLLTSSGFAQSETPKLEFGIHAAGIHFNGLDSTEPGLGGRVTLNFTRSFSVEGEYNYFPRAHRVGNNQVTDFGKKSQGLFGAKFGKRSERFGIFGKARPGFVRFEKLVAPANTVCIAIFPPPVSCLASKSLFALDLGGVFEFYPAKRIGLRFDVGDTLIYQRPITTGLLHKHNLQISTGVSFKF